MSYVDLDTATPHDLIAQFVLEYRGEGHCLPYTDYQVVAQWLEAARDPDSLLIVLADVIPAFYAKADKKKPPSLSRIRRKVLKLLAT